MGAFPELPSYEINREEIRKVNGNKMPGIESSGNGYLIVVIAKEEMNNHSTPPIFLHPEQNEADE